MKSLVAVLKVFVVLMLFGLVFFAIYMFWSAEERTPLRFSERAFTWKVKPPEDSLVYYKIEISTIRYTSDSTFAVTAPVKRAPVQFQEISGFQGDKMIFTVENQIINEVDQMQMDGFRVDYFDLDKPATILMEYIYPNTGYSAIYQADITFKQ